MYTDNRRPDGPMPVTVTDINIPFFSLMWFLVKLALAAIPATIIVAFIWAMVVGAIGSVIHSLGHQWTTL